MSDKIQANNSNLNPGSANTGGFDWPNSDGFNPESPYAGPQNQTPRRDLNPFNRPINIQEQDLNFVYLVEIYIGFLGKNYVQGIIAPNSFIDSLKRLNLFLERLTVTDIQGANLPIGQNPEIQILDKCFKKDFFRTSFVENPTNFETVKKALIQTLNIEAVQRRLIYWTFLSRSSFQKAYQSWDGWVIFGTEDYNRLNSTPVLVEAFYESCRQLFETGFGNKLSKRPSFEARVRSYFDNYPEVSDRQSANAQSLKDGILKDCIGDLFSVVAVLWGLVPSSITPKYDARDIVVTGRNYLYLITPIEKPKLVEQIQLSLLLKLSEVFETTISSEIAKKQKRDQEKQKRDENKSKEDEITQAGKNKADEVLQNLAGGAGAILGAGGAASAAGLGLGNETLGASDSNPFSNQTSYSSSTTPNEISTQNGFTSNPGAQTETELKIPASGGLNTNQNSSLIQDFQTASNSVPNNGVEQVGQTLSQTPTGSGLDISTQKAGGTGGFPTIISSPNSQPGITYSPSDDNIQAPTGSISIGSPSAPSSSGEAQVTQVNPTLDSRQINLQEAKASIPTPVLPSVLDTGSLNLGSLQPPQITGTGAALSSPLAAAIGLGSSAFTLSPQFPNLQIGSPQSSGISPVANSETSDSGNNIPTTPYDPFGLKLDSDGNGTLDLPILETSVQSSRDGNIPPTAPPIEATTSTLVAPSTNNLNTPVDPEQFAEENQLDHDHLQAILQAIINDQQEVRRSKDFVPRNATQIVKSLGLDKLPNKEEYFLYADGSMQKLNRTDNRQQTTSQQSTAQVAAPVNAVGRAISSSPNTSNVTPPSTSDKTAQAGKIGDSSNNTKQGNTLSPEESQALLDKWNKKDYREGRRGVAKDISGDEDRFRAMEELQTTANLSDNQMMSTFSTDEYTQFQEWKKQQENPANPFNPYSPEVTSEELERKGYSYYTDESGRPQAIANREDIARDIAEGTATQADLDNFRPGNVGDVNEMQPEQQQDIYDRQQRVANRRAEDQKDLLNDPDDVTQNLPSEKEDIETIGRDAQNVADSAEVKRDQAEQRKQNPQEQKDGEKGSNPLANFVKNQIIKKAWQWLLPILLEIWPILLGLLLIFALIFGIFAINIYAYCTPDIPLRTSLEIINGGVSTVKGLDPTQGIKGALGAATGSVQTDLGKLIINTACPERKGDTEICSDPSNVNPGNNGSVSGTSCSNSRINANGIDIPDVAWLPDNANLYYFMLATRAQEVGGIGWNNNTVGGDADSCGTYQQRVGEFVTSPTLAESTKQILGPEKYKQLFGSDLAKIVARMSSSYNNYGVSNSALQLAAKPLCQQIIDTVGTGFFDQVFIERVKNEGQYANVIRDHSPSEYSNLVYKVQRGVPAPEKITTMVDYAKKNNLYEKKKASCGLGTKVAYQDKALNAFNLDKLNQIANNLLYSNIFKRVQVEAASSDGRDLIVDGFTGLSYRDKGTITNLDDSGGGIDFALGLNGKNGNDATRGVPVVSHLPGIVTYVVTGKDGYVKGSRPAGSFGNEVGVYYPSIGETAIYSHLDSVNVKVNQSVQPGALLGKQGSSGSTVGGDGQFVHISLNLFKGKVSGQTGASSDVSLYNNFLKGMLGYYAQNLDKIKQNNFTPTSTTDPVDSASDVNCTPTSPTTSNPEFGSAELKPGGIILPVKGVFTACYGSSRNYCTEHGEDRGHGGVDIAAPTGTIVVAAADGVVDYASYDPGGYGLLIVIKHDKIQPGLESFYGHNSRLLVRKGQEVKQGQVIAYVGSTGFSTGPHSHFEIRTKTGKVNPCSVASGCTAGWEKTR